MSERNEWLANLKPGDEVGRQMVGGRGAYLHVDFLTVKRRTANYILIGSVNNKTYEQKFRASDGREPGNGMYVLSVPTDELKKQLAAQTRKDALLKIIDAVRWRDMPISTLEAVAKIVDPPLTERQEP